MFTHCVCFLTFTCQLHDSVIMAKLYGFEIENFSSPNHSQFAVECDGKSKIFQMRTAVVL